MKKRVAWLFIFMTVLIVVGVYVFNKTRPSFDKIPVMFNKSGIPCTRIKIGSCEYPMLIDFGSKCALTMHKNALDSIKDKKPLDSMEWKDLKGNAYTSSQYLLPKIHWDHLEYENIAVTQEEDQFITNTTLWSENPDCSIEILGSLGRPILTKHNLLLDFENEQIVILSDVQQLKILGLNVLDCIAVPFKEGRMGPIILVKTDMGEKRFAIDTGSTLNFLRAAEAGNLPTKVERFGLECVTSQRFIIGSKDFMETTLYLYDLTSELDDIDGILGMSFLRNHRMYFDFSSQVVYLR